MKSVRQILILLGLLLLFTLLLSPVMAQEPTTEPTAEPTVEPTDEPAAEPTAEPTAEATVEPVVTAEPLDEADENAIKINGALPLQGLVNALVEGFQAQAEGDFSFDVQTGGPDAAFTQLCAGEIDMVMAGRFITDEEMAACDAAEVEFIETVLAYEGLVFLISPNVEMTTTCVPIGGLAQLFGEDAEGNLQILNPNEVDTPLTIYAPAADSAAYNLASRVFPSELRPDLTPYESPQALIEQLTAGEQAGIGFLTLAEFESLGDLPDDLQPLQLQGESGACDAPSASTLELDYPMARPAMLYVRAASLETPGVREFFNYVNSEDGARLVAIEQNFTPASEVSYARNNNNLAIPQAGRTFSQVAAPIGITSAAEGKVVVNGTALAAPIFDALTGTFTLEYPAVQLEALLLNESQAWDTFCAGESDVIVVSSTPTAEQLSACEEAAIEQLEIPLGAHAVVVATTANQEDLPACMTLDELVTAFAAPVEPEAESTAIPTDEENELVPGVQTWTELNAEYPDVPLYILLPGPSSFELDWLFFVAGQTTRFTRDEEEANVEYGAADYRAAATANFAGGALTLLTWQEYQDRLTAETPEEGDPLENRIRLLEINAGENCVAPTEDTIRDGSYPLSANLRVVISANNLGDPAVGSFIWHLLSDNTADSLSDANLLFFDKAALVFLRDSLYTRIEAAQLAALEAAAQATAEPTAEASEGTAEPAATVEAEATQAPEAAGTTEPAAATAEPTAEATEASN